MHHNDELLGLFDTPDLRKLVGGRSREIYADSVPIKEAMLRELDGKPVEGASVEDLLREWTVFLGDEYERVKQALDEGKNAFLELVPSIARFTATSLALQKVAGYWVKDEDVTRRIQAGFSGFNTSFGKLLEEPFDGGGVDAADMEGFLSTPAGEYMGQVPSDDPRPSNLSQRQLLGVGILTRAYSSHLISCFSQHDLFSDERLDAHIEKLHSPDAAVRRMEIYTLAAIGDIRVLDHFARRFLDSDDDRERYLLSQALKDMVEKNEGDERLRTPQVYEAFR
jgi:hypothetical protein